MFLNNPSKSDQGRENNPARVRFFVFIGAKLLQNIIINIINVGPVPRTGRLMERLKNRVVCALK